MGKNSKASGGIPVIRNDAYPAAISGLTENNLTASFKVLANDVPAQRLAIIGLMMDEDAQPSVKAPLEGRSVRGAWIRADADGNVLYDANDFKDAFNSLAQGEIVQDSFAYLARIGNGVESAAQVTLEIRGLNDAPDVASNAILIQDSAGDDAYSETINKPWGASDPDNGARLAYKASSLSDPMGTVSMSERGFITIDIDHDALNGLAEGEEAWLNFPVTVVDEYGASGTGMLKLLFKGANDPANILGDSTGTVLLDEGSSASGSLVVTDADHGQSRVGGLTAQTVDYVSEPDDGEQGIPRDQIEESAVEAGELTVVDSPNMLTMISSRIVAPEEETPAPEEPTLSATGSYGDLIIDTSTGSWHYEARLEGVMLAAGATVQDVFTVTSADGSASVDIVISLIGAQSSGTGWEYS